MENPFVVTITEIWERTLVVDAETEAQARILAEEYYLNHIIGESDVLDAPEYLTEAVIDPEEMELVSFLPTEQWTVRPFASYDPDA